MPLAPFIPWPAVGEAYIGRQGLVRNLRGRIARGEALAVIGGPKLGKTSLVRTVLQGLPNRRAIEVDLRGGIRPIDDASGAIVVLDNLDAVSDDRSDALLAEAWGMKPASVIVTGGRRLRTMLEASRPVGMPLRVIPLSVLLDGETRRLIGPEGDPALASWSGNHPYLTKLLRHYGDDAVKTGRAQWELFVRHLMEEVGVGVERRLLDYLIDRGVPINPREAESATQILNMKTAADTLAYLGVISRWIRHEEATLYAGCRLLNEFRIAQR